MRSLSLVGIVTSAVLGLQFLESPFQKGTLNVGERQLLWNILDQRARTSSEAGFILYLFYQEGEAAQREIWGRFDQGLPWLDWWLVLRPQPPRMLNGLEFWMVLTSWDESEMHAVSARPEVLQRIVQGRLYTVAHLSGLKLGEEPITIDHIKEHWLYWKQDAYLETKGDDLTDLHHYYDENHRRRYWAEWVNRLRWCYWLFDKRDDVKRTTDRSWKSDYLAFRKWLTENEAFLRFDQSRFTFRVDREAKANGKALPDSFRVIPSPKAPFPNWKGVTPVETDYMFAVH